MKLISLNYCFVDINETLYDIYTCIQALFCTITFFCDCLFRLNYSFSDKFLVFERYVLIYAKAWYY